MGGGGWGMFGRRSVGHEDRCCCSLLDPAAAVWRWFVDVIVSLFQYDGIIASADDEDNRSEDGVETICVASIIKARHEKRTTKHVAVVSDSITARVVRLECRDDVGLGELVMVAEERDVALLQLVQSCIICR